MKHGPVLVPQRRSLSAQVHAHDGPETNNHCYVLEIQSSSCLPNIKVQYSSLVSFTQWPVTSGYTYLPALYIVPEVRSSWEQGSSSCRQQRRWAIVCGSPQSQLTECVLSTQPHLLIVVLSREIPVRRRFCERQQSHGWSDPAGRDSAASNPNLIAAGASVSWLFHICSLMQLGDESSSVTVHMKLFRDFNRPADGTWLYCCWLDGVVCLWRSTQLATVRLM